MMKHSKLPWAGCNKGKCQCGQIWSKGDDHPVLTVEHGEWGDPYPTLEITGGELDKTVRAKMDIIAYGEIPEEIAHGNVAFILEACNNYYDMREALEMALEMTKMEKEGDDTNQPMIRAYKTIKHVVDKLAG